MSDTPSAKQEISVAIDAEILDNVAHWTDDLPRAIAEGLELWCTQQAANQLRDTARVHQQRHDRDETGWLV